MQILIEPQPPKETLALIGFETADKTIWQNIPIERNGTIHNYSCPFEVGNDISEIEAVELNGKWFWDVVTEDLCK